MSGTKNMDATKSVVKECQPRIERRLVFAMVVVLATVIGVVIWQNLRDEETAHVSHNKRFLVFTQTPTNWPFVSGGVTLYENFTMEIRTNNEVKVTAVLSRELSATGVGATDCSVSPGNDICLLCPGDRKLTINHTRKSIARLNTDIDCYDIQWQALRCSNQVFTDCYDTTSANWYGGYADKQQYWPFDKNSRAMSPYVVNDSYIGEIGGVVERYFISSNGIGIFVNESTPLFFSLNDPNAGEMCFSAKFDRYPYYNNGSLLPVLKYSVCQSTDVKNVHLAMSELFLDRPVGIPNTALFKYPIWSTWAQYHKDINRTSVLEFANAILKNNFTHAQLEIDDDWTPAYGDMVFNEQKFPNASDMVKTLNNMGFVVTVWVHPFFNIESDAFKQAALFGLLVREVDSPLPALVPWWDGRLAGIFDPSFSTARNWYLAKLENLKSTYGIASFKFDAGETSWLPHVFTADQASMDPQDIFPKAYVKMAASSDPTNRIEVRAGYKTQKYPIFVRMMDKLSNWGHYNALKSVIPVVLTYGIIGYPFVLPDMIGGNAYNNHPEAELYIRWLQLNTFLPSMQYSIVPWQYNNSIVEIARNFTVLHEQISDTLINLAKESVTSGEPIIRPLWWIAPNDPVALKCEDQFLVGDEYLVAPVLDNGARSRDIYLPTGSWVDMLRGGFIEKPGWIRGYRVDIHELAYFRKQQTR